jgi:hypothetical protein
MWVSESGLCTIHQNSIAFYMQNFQSLLLSQGDVSIQLAVQSVQTVESLLNHPFLTLRRPVQYVAAGTDHEQTWWPRASFFKREANMLQR